MTGGSSSCLNRHLGLVFVRLLVVIDIVSSLIVERDINLISISLAAMANSLNGHRGSPLSHGDVEECSVIEGLKLRVTVEPGLTSRTCE
jgi:hypothetical protein